jgi:hypothetical protein
MFHRWSSARNLPTRLVGIEQNLRELNDAVERLERQVTAMVEVEVPGLFLAAERSFAERTTQVDAGSKVSVESEP